MISQNVWKMFSFWQSLSQEERTELIKTCGLPSGAPDPTAIENDLRYLSWLSDQSSIKKNELDYLTQELGMQSQEAQNIINNPNLGDKELLYWLRVTNALCPLKDRPLKPIQASILSTFLQKHLQRFAQAGTVFERMCGYPQGELETHLAQEKGKANWELGSVSSKEPESGCGENRKQQGFMDWWPKPSCPWQVKPLETGQKQPQPLAWEDLAAWRVRFCVTQDSVRKDQKPQLVLRVSAQRGGEMTLVFKVRQTAEVSLETSWGEAHDMPPLTDALICDKDYTHAVEVTATWVEPGLFLWQVGRREAGKQNVSEPEPQPVAVVWPLSVPVRDLQVAWEAQGQGWEKRHLFGSWLNGMEHPSAILYIEK